MECPQRASRDASRYCLFPPFRSAFVSLSRTFGFPYLTPIAHPTTPHQPGIRLNSPFLSTMSIPIVTTPPALSPVNSFFPMEPETPQDRVVDENSLQSLLEVPSDIDRVKDLFWRLEDLSSFRPTPQQWHNQYLPLLNVYTERMKHGANKQGISRFYYACCRAPKRAHRTKVPDAERQRNRQQADKDACGQHFVALQHGNSFMEFQISEEVKNSTHTHDIDICNQKRPPKKSRKSSASKWPRDKSLARSIDRYARKMTE